MSVLCFSKTFSANLNIVYLFSPVKGHSYAALKGRHLPAPIPVKAYPTDDLGPELVGNFAGALEAMANGGDIYDYMGVEDSLVRERLFTRLSEMLGLDYEHIYQLWLNKAVSLDLKKKAAENGIAL